MDYDLNEPGGGDTISCGSLYVGGSLAFSNFGFGYTSNFGPGVYDLIYSTSLPSNLLGNSTSGLVDGYPANLAVSGNYVVLSVVPEPSTLAPLGVGWLGLFGFWWRRRNAERASHNEMGGPETLFASAGANRTSIEVISPKWAQWRVASSP